MTTFERISPINSIQFAEASPSMPSFYHTYYKDLFVNQIKPWEAKVDYAQKVQFNDHFPIQVDTIAPDLRIMVMDKNDNILATYTPISKLAIPGNTQTINGMTYQVNTFQHYLSFGLLEDIPEGFYWIVIKAVYDADTDSNNVYYQSEPLHVKTDHPGTILLEYTNSVNDHDIIFELLYPIFRLRVEGDINSYVPVSSDTVFDNQNHKIEVLDSVPYDNYNLQIGGPFGVPDYMLRKVNWALSCDKLKIEGRYFTKENNVKWTLTTAPNYPMQGGTCLLRDYDHSAIYTFTKQPLTLFTSPAAYPYAAQVLFAFFVNGLPFFLAGFSPKIFTSSDDETAYITDLNNLGAAQGLTGTFTLTDGVFKYNVGEGEFYDTSLCSVFAYGFDVTVNVAALTDGIQTFKFNYAGTPAIVQWESGEDGQFVMTPTGTSVGTSFTVSHNYTSTGTKSLKIFSAVNGIQQLNISYSTANIYVTNIWMANANGIGTALIFFGVSNQNIVIADGGTLFLSVLLTPSIYTLVVLQYYNNQTPKFMMVGGPNLRSINISKNKLSYTLLDAIIVGLTSSTVHGYASGGSFNSRGQSPASVPTSVSLASRNKLIAAGWSLAYDS